MREKGLEPPRRKAPDPKSGASANSATPALRGIFYRRQSVMSITFYKFLRLILHGRQQLHVHQIFDFHIQSAMLLVLPLPNYPFYT